MDAEKPAPSAWRTWRSSRCRPRARKILVVNVELLLPVVDDRAAEELRRPLVHLAGDLFGDVHEHADRDGWPASGCAGCRATSSRPGRARPRRRTSSRRRRTAARRRRCECCLDRCVGARGGAGALNPLALEICRNLAADKLALASVANLDRGAADDGLRIEEADALASALRGRCRRSIRASINFLRSRSKRRQALERGNRRRREHVCVVGFERASDFEFARGCSHKDPMKVLR